MPGDDSGVSESTEPSEGDEWERLADLVGGSMELAERGAALADAISADWQRLAQSDRAWTTDTIFNELVNSWEHWTPLLGDAIQQSIDLGSWWLKSFWPGAADDLDALREGADEAPLGPLAAQYLETSTRAVRRMLADDYSSADAVDDWATAVGAASKEAWRQSANVNPRPRAEPRDGDEPSAEPADDGQLREDRPSS